MAKLPQGLFGGMGTPEEMQQQLTEQRAMKFATMSPRQQTSYNIYKNTGNLGRGLASAMGVDVQDPLVRQATTLRQMASQFNTGTAAGMREYAQAISSIDPETANRAMMMADEMELTQAKIGSEQALTKQREREKESADPLQKLLEKGVYKPSSLKKFKDSGNPDDLEFKDSEAKTSVIKADGRTKLINSQTGEVIADLGAASEGIKIINEIPGLKGTGDIVSLRQNLNNTLKPYRDAVNASDAAIALADDVLKTGNFASASALSRQLAKAAGEQQLSKADVDAFGGDPSLVGMVSDVASRLATGTPTADTTRKLKQLATIIKKKNEALEDNEIKQTQRTAELSGLYKPEQIKEVFTLRGAKQAGGNKRTTKSGVTYYVSEEE